jgi:hypothetical protein
MIDVLKPGAIGQAVSDLQTQLRAAGFDAPATSVYDDATQAAVSDLQRARGLVVDGFFGPKSRAALAGLDTSRLLREADLIHAADTLGVPLASIKAVNEVESNGRGFLPDGRPCILFERHWFYKRLSAHGIDPAPQALRVPAIVNQQRGGYAGGAAEYTRLAAASQICRPAALEATSWGAFQIMGFHWEALGYASAETFVTAMERAEADQLDAFSRFIKDNPAMHKALAARKWAVFAREYNGAAYAENHYDVKLSRAYERYASQLDKVAA